MDIPTKLQWLENEKTGTRWLRELPDLVSSLSHMWDLTLGPAYESGNVSFVVSATRGRERLVLKVQWPHEESAHEADALMLWNGHGAVRLIAHDRERHALLLERCEPGTELSRTALGDPIGVLVDLLPRLWKPAGEPFRSLAEEAAGWSIRMVRNWEATGRPCERSMVDAALAFIADLKDTQGEQVLIHQDLHGDNVLAAEREPWLAIDPKPLSGERAFGIAPIVRSFEFGESRSDTLYRFDRLTADLGLDRRRALGWTVAQTMAWSFGSDFAAYQHDVVRWLLADRAV